jgi:aerobic carbon-monoxide dehydrogenase small subunit
VTTIETEINGEGFTADIDDGTWLLDLVRDELGLTGTKRSCEVQVCGACTVLVDGNPVSSCCFLAIDVDGREVTTIEGLVGTPFYQRVSDAIMSHAAVQCGFCTPGLVTTLDALRQTGASFDRESLAGALRGTVCRCTGYKSILDAALSVLGTSDDDRN